MPTLSVAMIVQNEAEMLPFSLTGLLPLAHLLQEVVIIDGGSHDTTQSTIDDYKKLLPIISLYRKFDTFKNQKNFALDQCTGDWVLGIDADMIMTAITLRSFLASPDLENADVWDCPLYFAKGDLRHYDEPSKVGPTTRLWRNCGLRYVRDVHEYLCYPNHTELEDSQRWESIHNPYSLQVGDFFCIELSMLKTAEGLQERVRRYGRWAEKSRSAGISIDDMQTKTDGLIFSRWKDTAPIPDHVLRGINPEVFDIPIPYMTAEGII